MAVKLKPFLRRCYFGEFTLCHEAVSKRAFGLR